MTDDRHTRLLIGLGVVTAILLGKIFSIQVIDRKYKAAAEGNSTFYEMIYPIRGVIYDRKGKILVGNKVAYDIMVTPKEVEPFDTVALAAVLETSEYFVKDKFQEFNRNKRSIGFKSVVFMKQVPSSLYNHFAEVAYKFPGFKGQMRSVRDYPINAGGNLLGYVSEVNPAYIARHEGEYKPGDYAGMTGIEAAREKELRGEKGYHVYLRNARNQIQESYKNGEMDKDAIPGTDVHTTIDADLQQYGQQLMRNKVGAVVALEPSTGEILALVSSPGVDVYQLAEIGRYYEALSKNPYKPMYNRAVQASYPPGSVFKLVNGLIGLQEGVLKPSYTYPCSQGYHFKDGTKIGCHHHRSPINMDESIMMSCNAYYCYVLKNILENPKYESVSEALDKWHEYVESFGFGHKLGSDFPSELSGSIPSSKTYDRKYRKGRWNASTVLSLSIGQGEILATPLHLANFCATIANRGYYYTPHLVKASEGVEVDPKYYRRNYTMVDAEHFQKLIPGMWKAVNAPAGSGGTAAIAHVDSLEICGKTGTAQNPRGADHSVFICFAPRENPQIAIAAYIENGGFGATFAAPIASLMVEKYLKGSVQRKDLEVRMRTSNTLIRVRTR